MTPLHTGPGGTLREDTRMPEHYPGKMYAVGETMPAPSGKFQRAATTTPHSVPADDVGRVLVMVTRRGQKGVAKGSLVRTLHVEDARVSDVANAIDRALFG